MGSDHDLKYTLGEFAFVHFIDKHDVPSHIKGPSLDSSELVGKRLSFRRYALYT